MNDDLRNIPFLLEIARKTKSVIALNITVAILLAIVGLALAATGRLYIWVTPFYQAAAYIFVIANSLRLVRFGEDFAAAEEIRREQEAAVAAKPTRKLAGA
jgi:Cd2+/Zn2+-exporting ATPase